VNGGPGPSGRLRHHELCFGCGQQNLFVTGRLEVELLAPAPVGAFVDLTADVESTEGRKVTLVATASGEDGRPLARGRSVFLESAAGGSAAS
jgi:hypothetical protein